MKIIFWHFQSWRKNMYKNIKIKNLLVLSIQLKPALSVRNGRKKLVHWKEIWRILIINYELLPCMFQNLVKNSQTQNDLRVIVNEEEDLKSGSCLNLPKWICKLSNKRHRQHFGLSGPKYSYNSIIRPGRSTA